MKTIRFAIWLACLAVGELCAQGQVTQWKLAGVVNVGTLKRVLLVRSPVPSTSPGLVILAEGQRDGAVEVISINPETGSAEVRLDQTNSVVLRLINPPNASVAGIDFEQGAI